MKLKTISLEETDDELRIEVGTTVVLRIKPGEISLVSCDEDLLVDTITGCRVFTVKFKSTKEEK
jgi:hypothetical protein